MRYFVLGVYKEYEKKSLVDRDRIGIAFKTETTPSYPFVDKKNYLCLVSGVSGSNKLKQITS